MTDAVYTTVFRVSDKIIIIIIMTGSSEEIGKETASLIAVRGVKLTLQRRHADKLNRVAERIELNCGSKVSICIHNLNLTSL